MAKTNKKKGHQKTSYPYSKKPKESSNKSQIAPERLTVTGSPIDTKEDTSKNENTKKRRVAEVNDKRTEAAYDKVKYVLENYPNIQKDFRSLARSFPTMVHNNGLSATIAFLKVKKEDDVEKKGENQHNLFYEILKDWLILDESDQPVSRISISKNELNGKESDPSDLLEAIVQLPRDKYRMVTKEVMVYTQWIKRFAEGMLSKDDGSE
ncbi:MAG: type III-B CRISPR module-associated protein Cmr5 [Defluviitaleaceae bacterium]|nr:type III-B CRISPR module-associated protein Cmr5 [Defluviitaleaceae bacterium]